MCDVRGVAYDFETRAGRLRMAPEDCCDMSACVALFTTIDPTVRAIETFAGEVPDTIYKRLGNRWHALTPAPFSGQISGPGGDVLQ